VALESPIAQLLSTVDKLDIDAAVGLCTPDCHFAAVDGRSADGRENVHRLLEEFTSTLRSTAHRIAEEWHQNDVWIAEVLADYELRDWLRIEGLPRAFFVRVTTDGIADVRVYGAREQPLGDVGDDKLARLGGRPVLPL
jgi:hypothetical protein